MPLWVAQSGRNSAVFPPVFNAPPDPVRANPWNSAPKLASRPSAVQKSSIATPDSRRFINLICGIGGFRIAFEKAGGNACVEQ